MTIASFPREVADSSPAERIAKLQAELRVAGRQQIQRLADKLNEVSALSADIAANPTAYPVGAVDIARRLTEEAGKQALTLTAIVERAQR